MDIYQLDYILHEPEESEGWMYLAEVPALQGCMAWGETPEETLKSLLAVAQSIIQLRKENREPLPPEITPPAQPRRQPERNRMTYREMRRKLEILGCRFQRQTDGSHEMWVNPANGRRTSHPQAR